MINPVLERLAANIFREPYASDGKVVGEFQPARKMAKSAALQKAVLQINGPRQITYLCFDIDRRLGGLAWEDANLPVPNIVVINPANLHAHLIYELENSIWLRKKDDDRPGEAKPVRYLKTVYKAMKRALKADPGYNGLMVKNPFYSKWRTVIGRNQPYQLSDLAAHLDLQNSDSYDCDLRDNTEGRNCTLFDSIRYWAYRHVNDHSDRESFRHSLTDELDRLNHSLTSPLGYREVTGIAKSVFEWVWTRYTGNGNVKRRGIMGLNPAEPLRARQQQGQAYTSGVRRDSTVQRIQHAIGVLSREGKRVCKSTVASFCKLHRNTVARYWDQVTAVTVRDRVNAPLRGKSSALPAVGSAAPSQRDTLIHTQGSTLEAPLSKEQSEKAKAAYIMVHAAVKRLQERRTSEPDQFQAIDNRTRQRSMHIHDDNKPTTQ